MLISELIAELEKFKAENGDIEATILSDYGGYYPTTSASARSPGIICVFWCVR